MQRFDCDGVAPGDGVEVEPVQHGDLLLVIHDGVHPHVVDRFLPLERPGAAHVDQLGLVGQLFRQHGQVGGGHQIVDDLAGRRGELHQSHAGVIVDGRSPDRLAFGLVSCHVQLQPLGLRIKLLHGTLVDQHRCYQSIVAGRQLHLGHRLIRANDLHGDIGQWNFLQPVELVGRVDFVRRGVLAIRGAVAHDHQCDFVAAFLQRDRRVQGELHPVAIALDGQVRTVGAQDIAFLVGIEAEAANFGFAVLRGAGLVAELAGHVGHGHLDAG